MSVNVKVSINVYFTPPRLPTWKIVLPGSCSIVFNFMVYFIALKTVTTMWDQLNLPFLCKIILLTLVGYGGKQLTQGVCCALLMCVSKTIGRREIFFGRTRTRSKIGRCAVSGSRWRSREGVLLCGAAAAVDPRRWGRRLWQGLLWPVWGSWGGGRETKVWVRSWDRRQILN